jgi:hypothetical protein
VLGALAFAVAGLSTLLGGSLLVMGLASDSEDFYSFRFGANGTEDGVSTGFVAGETLIWIGAFLIGAATILVCLGIYVLRRSSRRHGVNDLSRFTRREGLSDKLR